ncbi:hypothetical protein [Streptomyces sp. NPDC020489]|uniref:hypothetical protein n=1 Tax=Streptomyces sp. NPDC020489 TaxID=3365077 RepID=UPI00378D0822
MALPYSKSQIERLGKRLIATGEPSEEDLDALNELLLAYDELLAAAMSEVRTLGYDPTGRVKNTGTILEKLARHGGSWLKSIQDLAGMRIVLDCDRQGQDAAASEIIALFSSCPREPRLVDRRSAPSNGYRAVHVIVFPQGVPIEVQVRTLWQHEWADVFEKLADLVGRGIRYGEPPMHWWDESLLVRADGRDAQSIRRLYDLAYKARTTLVKSVLVAGDLIDALEAAVAQGVDPDDPQLREIWATVQQDLADYRDEMRHMTPPKQP